MVHCNPASPVSRSRPMVGRATFTTVVSRNTMADPRTDAASTHRPAGVPQATATVGNLPVVEPAGMTDVGAAYAAGRHRLTELVEGLDDEAAAATVPCWPAGSTASAPTRGPTRRSSPGASSR